MIIIGLDPHVKKPYAVCTIQDGLIISVYEEADLSAFYYSLEEWELSGEKIFIGIEDQFYSKNVKTLTDLAHSAGKIAGVCEVLGIDYRYIQPRTWQKIYDIPLKTKGFTAYVWKSIHSENLINEAKKLTKVDIKNDDHASAVLIACYLMKDINNTT